MSEQFTLSADKHGLWDVLDAVRFGDAALHAAGQMSMQTSGQPSREEGTCLGRISIQVHVHHLQTTTRKAFTELAQHRDVTCRLRTRAGPEINDDDLATQFIE